MVCLKIRQLWISRVANEAAMISTDGNNRKKHKQLTPVTLFIVGHKEGAEPNEMYSTNKCNMNLVKHKGQLFFHYFLAMTK